MKPEPNWEAESLRLTVFLAPSATPPPDRDWWVEVVGSQPENKTVKPTRGETVEVGALGDNSLSLTIQPGRVDWVLSPSQAKWQDSGIRIKTIGAFPGVLDDFVLAMEKWLKDCPPLIRLAFGAVLLEPSDDKDSGYRRLSEYLSSIKVDSEGSQDFFYQINRPRKSHVDDSVLNRLSKWSISLFQPVNVAMAVVAGQQPVVITNPGEAVFACRLELDLSTPAQMQEELSHERLGDIFRELVNLGLEIATEGDIP